MLRPLFAVGALSVILLISGCNGANTPIGEAGRANDQSPSKPPVDPAPLRKALTDAESKLATSGVRFELRVDKVKILFPATPDDPESALQPLREYLAAANKLKAVESLGEWSEAKRELAGELLAKWEIVYTPAAIAAAKVKKAGEAKVAEATRVAAEQEKTNTTALTSKLRDSEKALDELGIAFEVKQSFGSTSVVLSSLREGSKLNKPGQEIDLILGILEKTSEYYRQLGELLALKSYTGQDRVAFELKQKLIFKIGAVLAKNISESAVQKSAGDLEKLGLRRKVVSLSGGAEFAFYDLKHLTSVKSANPAEIRTILIERNRFATHNLTLFPIALLIDKDFSNRDRDNGLFVPLASQKKTFTEEHGDLINGEWAAKYTRMANDEKKIADLITDDMTHEQLLVKLTSKLKADLTRIIVKSDSVLKSNLGVVIKNGTVDSDALTDFKKAMRFKIEPKYSEFGHLESLMNAYQLENMLARIASGYPKEIPGDGVQTEAEAKAAAIKAFGEEYYEQKVKDSNDQLLKQFSERLFKQPLPKGFDQ